MGDEIPVPHYDPPLDQLLAIGRPVAINDEWPDYLQLYGLTAEHIPQLIRMATDMELHEGDPESPVVYAPIHAWRALARLRADSAVRPLINLLHRLEEDDWLHEEMPEVFAMIGAAAVPIVEHYLADRSHGDTARMTTSTALAKIGEANPELRDQCVSILTKQLAKLERNDALNAFLIGALVDLKATESAPIIERAFRLKLVDEMVQGGWGDVQVELGLAEPKPTPNPLSVSQLLAGYNLGSGEFDELEGFEGKEDIALEEDENYRSPTKPPAPSKSGQKKKAKRKQEKQSRKVNRKRK